MTVRMKILEEDAENRDVAENHEVRREDTAEPRSVKLHRVYS